MRAPCQSEGLYLLLLRLEDGLALVIKRPGVAILVHGRRFALLVLELDQHLLRPRVALYHCPLEGAPEVVLDCAASARRGRMQNVREKGKPSA